MDMTGISNITTKLGDLLTPAWQRDSNTRPGLSQVIERLRRRWRLRHLLNGLFTTLVVMIALIVISAWLLNQLHFAQPAVWLLRFTLIFTVVGLLFQFCVRPLRRDVSESRVALYLQEHEPSLKSIILSAVEAGQSATPDTSPQLASRLVEQAIDACEHVGFGYPVEQKKLRRATSKLGLALLVIVGLAASPPEFLRRSATALLIPWTTASQYSPYRIELAPGNIEIARGGDQLISARIPGFDGSDVLLLTSTDGGISWQQATMTAGSDTSLYESFLFDLGQAVDYYVTGAGQQSGTYRIDVADIPAISEISLHYHFPPYTMLEPETSHGSGDISALRGTRVEVLIEPTIEIPGGALLLGDGQRIELENIESGSWIGELTVTQDSSYRVSLQRASGIPVDASADFQITALDDMYPDVSILSPGRDTKVSMIEEPVMKVRATDDLGIAKLELVVTVNGADEQRIALMPSGNRTGARRELDAEHVIYLEDLNLVPGDLISYYVHAEDHSPAELVKTATSDIFFYQVRPFSIDFRKADQQGGGGGGGAQGGQQQGHLSDQQKQFVVATFKMIRDRNSYDAETYQQNLELLATAQSRIRDRVEAIMRRLANRPLVHLDQRYRVIITELPRAAEAMVEVEKQLQQIEIESALSSAQVALLHLQRADAAFREINVALANRGGGGAGNTAGFEDLADLFRLEMDKLRHQYETVQRGQPQSSEQVIDEALERLRELAQRQQREIERQLRRQEQSLGNNPNAKQLALAEELEEMARQLERLSRTQPNPQLQQSINQMKDAAKAMRRAAASGSNGGTSADQARQAAQNLRKAQRLLDQSRVRKFSDSIERTLRRAELAERKQAAIKQDVMQLDQKWGDRQQNQLEQLDNQKQALSGELAELESELSKLVATAREEQPKASQPLRQAIRAGREYRLNDRIGRTRDMVQLGRKEQAIDNETRIQQGITSMRERIESALANIDQQGTRGMQLSLDRMRALAQELQSIQNLRKQAARGDAAANRADANGGGSAGLWQQFESIVASADDLGQRLNELGVASGEIDPVLDKIRELTQQQDDTDLAATSRLHEQALWALMELEFKLRMQSSNPEYPELLVSGSTELPDAYQSMVADYYRSLSQP
ncbi:MAG: hypothetical protein OES20_02750 [Gammaproteobacteria bacterium]|nr:hypothetical protein [Gammaproteobacteria bacterium]